MLFQEHWVGKQKQNKNKDKLVEFFGFGFGFGFAFLPFPLFPCIYALSYTSECTILVFVYSQSTPHLGCNVCFFKC
jgi:hypothetical protein